MKPNEPWWRQGWFFILCLTAGTILAYQPVWKADFLWDDDTYITRNAFVRQSDGWWRAWIERSNDYVPATETTFWLEWRLWARNPLGYHIDNLLLHIANALLLWRILQRLKVGGAWLAAAIFAVHPVNVASVAWVTERKNTLAMLFFLLAILCYVKFEDSGRRRWYWSAAVAFCAALFSKTAVAPFPLVLLGLCWCRRGRIEARDLIRSLPFFVLAMAGALAGTWNQHVANSGMAHPASFLTRLAGAGWAFWFYLGKALFPVNLIPVYPLWHFKASDWMSYLPDVAVAGVFGMAWFYRHKGGKALLAALGYFFALLIPVLGFVYISLMFLTPVADHWEYFAIAGPIALVAFYLDRLLNAHTQALKSARPAILALLLGGLGILTWKQCGVYQNRSQMWKATLAADPNSFAAYSHIGVLLYDQGKTTESIKLFEKAIALKPDFLDAHYGLGNAFLRGGFSSKALGQYKTVLELLPEHVMAMNNLAWIMAACPDATLRDGPRAIELAARANQLNGSPDPSIYGTLAAAYAEAGNFPQAIKTAEQGIDLAAAKGETAQIDDLRTQLQNYQKNLPFRDPTLR